MEEVTQEESNLSGLSSQVVQLKRLLSLTKVRQVRSRTIQRNTRDIVIAYFRVVRPELAQSNINLGDLDSLMQQLMEFTSKQALLVNYKITVRKIEKILPQLEIEKEIAFSNAAFKENKDTLNISEIDAKIITTLEPIIPSAALSYRQVLVDLKDEDKISFRGTASELREVLRETLDYLAPDDDVEADRGFKFEKDNKGNLLPKPTMKQKARFILKSRGRTRTAIKTPETAVNMVEEMVAAFTRSIYERGSLNTHKIAKKPEVMELKGYTESVLCELLEIHHN